MENVIVNETSPSVIWTEYMDLLSEYGKYMKHVYVKMVKQNNPITWLELDKMNSEIHDKLDKIRPLK